MDKVIKDGEVAILVSSGYGAGWSTWAREYADDLLFEPTVVDMLMDNMPADAIIEYVEKTYKNVYTGGVEGLYVEWLPVGTKFRIDEYDGHESIITEENLYMVA